MSTGPFRRILVPHDFSRQADRALRLAAKLPGVRQLLVLHVIEPFHGPTDPIYAVMIPSPQSLVPEQRLRLEQRARALLGRRGPAVTARVVVGDPGSEIVKAARGFDLVAMATTGRTGVPHLLIGSVAERVVRLSATPVLTLRAPSRRQSRK